MSNFGVQTTVIGKVRCLTALQTVHKVRYKPYNNSLSQDTE